jgi:hypothetical protein
MAEPPRRYLFHPLERRGLLLGLHGTQIAVLAGGAGVAIGAGQVVPGVAGPGLAVAALACAGVLTLWSRGGRPLAGWAAVLLPWIKRRAAGPRLASGPLSGQCSFAPSLQPFPPDRCGLDGVDLLECPRLPGLAPLGVIRDRRAGTWAAVLPVEGLAFPLLDADDQIRRLEGWRTVLGTLARAGTPLRRVQWIQRSLSAPALTVMATDTVHRGGPAAESYHEAVCDTAPAVRSYQTWLVICVGDGRRSGSPGRGWVDQLAREVRLLDGQLRNAELRAGNALDLDGLRGLLGGAHQSHPSGVAGGRLHPWSLASDEAWSAVRMDGTWHATYWISEWPRVEVGPDFLTPLLLGSGRRTVAVVMAPVSAGRAIREVRAARTADAADEELRIRAGFLPSTRRHREAEGVLRREAELADGHSDYRFSGYVTVTAEDREALESACIETEQAAQSSNLHLLRLYGRQAEAFTWTLPLGRGLA